MKPNMNQPTPVRVQPVVVPQCACVHHDPYECARIRDGRHARDEDDYHKRSCECECHSNEDYDEEW